MKRNVKFLGISRIILVGTMVAIMIPSIFLVSNSTGQFANFTISYTLTEPNTQSNGLYGGAVAVSGNVTIVGAPGEAQGGGGVYVYNMRNGALDQSLFSPELKTYGGYGGSVAISGDLAAVGAEGEGNVYVYDTATWKIIQNISAPSGQSGFANAVAINGNTVYVVSGGNVDLFNAYTGGLVKTLTNPNDNPFGSSIAVSGNLVMVPQFANTSLNSDGFSFAGVGYVYVYNTNSGNLVKTLAIPGTEVCTYGIDCPDGVTTQTSVALVSGVAIVGVPYMSASGFNQTGAAFVYNATTWSNQTLTSPNEQANGFFGWSVATNGNIAMIGAPTEGSNSGNSYLFNTTNGTLIQTLPNQNQAGLGYSVAINGTIAAIGAPFPYLASCPNNGGGTGCGGHVDIISNMAISSSNKTLQTSSPSGIGFSTLTTSSISTGRQSFTSLFVTSGGQSHSTSQSPQSSSSSGILTTKSTSKGGGIPSYSLVTGIAAAFTVVVIASYLVIRRHSVPKRT